MALDPRTPVLVGVGFADQRCDDPREAVEALDLMGAALEAAADDAGARALLGRAGSVRVPRGFWEYADPGRMLAERLGISGACSVLAELGILQQTLLTDACRAIAEGDEDVALVVGGEARHRSQRAASAGIELRDAKTDSVPDVRLEPREPFWADLEAQQGLMMPVQFFAVMENALRFADGQDLDAHRDEVATLWAGMSAVAADNPHAWSREVVAPGDVAKPTASNRMLSFPYAKRHNSNWNVDQAAALILCSVETARALGVPEARWVFAASGTESNHVVPVSARGGIHRCPAIALAGQRALDLAGIDIEQVAHFDLYSCFPAPVRIFARELGIPGDRSPTVTGGMAFAGGPLNNYVLQATARMAEVLRADRGSAGLVTCVSGFLNKQGFGVWSTDPGRAGFGSAELSEESLAATDVRALVADCAGPARIASYTVVHRDGEPLRGVAICDLPDGRRTVAVSEDRALATEMTTREFCGLDVELDAGTLRRVG